MGYCTAALELELELELEPAASRLRGLFAGEAEAEGKDALK